MTRHGCIRYMQSDLDRISRDVLDKYKLVLPSAPSPVGFQKVTTSGHHFSGTGTVPNVNHDDWNEEQRYIRNTQRIAVKQPPAYTTFSATRREQIITKDVPSTEGAKSLADINAHSVVFYNPRSGEVECVLFDRNGDSYRFYSMYYAMSGGILEATGAAFKKLAKRNTHVFAFKNEGLKWGTLADITLWLESPSSRIKFDGDPADYDLLERSYAFATLQDGRPTNLDFSRVMLTFARMTPTPPPTLIERLG